MFNTFAVPLVSILTEQQKGGNKATRFLHVGDPEAP